MVTVCQPGYGGYGHGGYGHGGYGHQYCNEVAQTTQYNVPTVPAVDVDVKVAYPAPKKVCVDKPIDLPRVTCEDLSEEKCIQVPEIEESSVTVDKCTYALGKAACQAIELTLPKQVCVELVYGYAHEEHKHEPAPAPAYLLTLLVHSLTDLVPFPSILARVHPLRHASAPVFSNE